MAKKNTIQKYTPTKLVTGEIVELSYDAVLFEQQFCRCLLFKCQCETTRVWIPKSVITRSGLYEPQFCKDQLIWEKGKFSMLVEEWFYNQHLNPLNQLKAQTKTVSPKRSKTEILSQMLAQTNLARLP
ncbi:MAG TPA: hypothetical protein PKY82_31310 [Pyrinomonadaceae bacterium]|nr:hypothetical protein [Pyrinomonadaceae bacterium]